MLAGLRLSFICTKTCLLVMTDVVGTLFSIWLNFGMNSLFILTNSASVNKGAPVPPCCLGADIFVLDVLREVKPASSKKENKLLNYTTLLTVNGVFHKRCFTSICRSLFNDLILFDLLCLMPLSTIFQ